MQAPWKNHDLSIRSNTVVGLTSAGITKAEGGNLSGSLGEVIDALNSENGHLMVVSEIVNKTGLSEKKVKEIIVNYRPFIRVQQSSYD